MKRSHESMYSYGYTLLPEKEIELIVCRARELSTKKLEFLHPTRPKILTDLLERRTQELKAILER